MSLKLHLFMLKKNAKTLKKRVIHSFFIFNYFFCDKFISSLVFSYNSTVSCIALKIIFVISSSDLFYAFSEEIIPSKIVELNVCIEFSYNVTSLLSISIILVLLNILYFIINTSNSYILILFILFRFPYPVLLNIHPI